MSLEVFYNSGAYSASPNRIGTGSGKQGVVDEEKGGKEPTNLDAVSLAEALDELHGQPLARLRHLSSASPRRVLPTTAAACWRGAALTALRRVRGR